LALESDAEAVDRTEVHGTIRRALVVAVVAWFVISRSALGVGAVGWHRRLRRVPANDHASIDAPRATEPTIWLTAFEHPAHRIGRAVGRRRTNHRTRRSRVLCVNAVMTKRRESRNHEKPTHRLLDLFDGRSTDFSANDGVGAARGVSYLLPFLFFTSVTGDAILWRVRSEARVSALSQLLLAAQSRVQRAHRAAALRDVQPRLLATAARRAPAAAVAAARSGGGDSRVRSPASLSARRAAAAIQRQCVTVVVVALFCIGADKYISTTTTAAAVVYQRRLVQWRHDCRRRTDRWRRHVAHIVVGRRRQQQQQCADAAHCDACDADAASAFVATAVAAQLRYDSAQSGDGGRDDACRHRAARATAVIAAAVSAAARRRATEPKSAAATALCQQPTRRYRCYCCDQLATATIEQRKCRHRSKRAAAVREPRFGCCAFIADTPPPAATTSPTDTIAITTAAAGRATTDNHAFSNGDENTTKRQQW
jgi:hypothetical protein